MATAPHGRTPNPDWHDGGVPGLHCVTLPDGHVSALATILVPDVPWVLVERHFPHPPIEWAVADVPLSDQSMRSTARRTVRNLEMDVLMSTAEFLKALPEFSRVGASVGIQLWQLKCEPPARRFTDIPARSRAEAYRALGVRLSFFLPHDGEPALICSPEQSVIDEVSRRWNESPC